MIDYIFTHFLLKFNNEDIYLIENTGRLLTELGNSKNLVSEFNTNDNINKLTKHCVHFVIDDFGSGLGSLLAKRRIYPTYESNHRSRNSSVIGKNSGVAGSYKRLIHLNPRISQQSN